MPLNRSSDFTMQFFDLLDVRQGQIRVAPTYLGGSSGSGGGYGTPPGGFIGQLAQKYVAYDATEAETTGTNSGSSILDNLNHIRWRITNMSTGSGGSSGSLSNATPLSLGTATPGISGLGSRGDHVHGHGVLTDGTFHALSTQTNAGFLRTTTTSTGSYLDATGNWSVPPAGSGVLSNMPALTLGATALAGTSGSSSRYDHVHTHGVLTDGTLHGLASQSGAGFLRTVAATSGSFLNSTGNWSIPAASATLSSAVALGLGAASAGTSGSASRYDHVHPNTLSSQASQGLLRALASTSGSYLDSGGNWSVPTGGGSSLLPFAPLDVLSPYSTDDITVFTSTVESAATITHYVQTLRVNTTNNGSNYWQVALLDFNALGTLVDFDTSALAADTWTRVDSGAVSVAITTSMKGIVVHLWKIGSPGTLELFCPAVKVA